MTDEQKECFAHNLKLARFLNQMSQADLAKAANIKPLSRIGNFEECRGAPKTDEFINICKALGQPMDDMINRKAKIIIQYS